MASLSDAMIPEEGHSSLRMETSADVAKEVTTTAKARIRHHPHLKSQRIWCEFNGGKLFVRGQVPSFFYKQLAQEAVQRIRDVGQILNEIEVVW